jgi:hypothetical protein
MARDPGETQVDVDRMCSWMRASFEDFGQKRINSGDIGFFDRIYRDGLPSARLLRIIAPALRGKSPVGGRRLMFMSARYPELLGACDPAEVVVLGGPADWRVARRLGVPFCSSADLFLASYDVLFGRPAARVEQAFRRWMEFFRRQSDPGLLIVANDTMPMALALVAAARESPNIRLVCIQHGLFSAGPAYQDDDVEGRNSDINLVFSTAQQRHMERRLGGGLVEVMGLPHDLRASRLSARPEVILVGTGTLGDMHIYGHALGIFSAVRDRLSAAGHDVVYRPHASERGLARAGELFRMDSRGKEALLTGASKVFVGFASTLLYEADQAGHIAIVLDDPVLPGYPLRDFGWLFSCAEMEQLGPFLDARLAGHALPVTAVSSVGARFEAALAAALVRLEVSEGPRRLRR